MSTQLSKNNIESYISDLLGNTATDDVDATITETSANAEHQEQIHNEDTQPSTPIILADDDQYLSFAVAGSDFMIAATQVVSVKSFANPDAYKEYQLNRVDHLLNLSRPISAEEPQFVLILEGERNYAIRVDTIYGLVTVPAERLLVRKAMKDRPWYTAISRDFQSALLNSYPLGVALAGS